MAQHELRRARTLNPASDQTLQGHFKLKEMEGQKKRGSDSVPKKGQTELSRDIQERHFKHVLFLETVNGISEKLGLKGSDNQVREVYGRLVMVCPSEGQTNLRMNIGYLASALTHRGCGGTEKFTELLSSACMRSGDIAAKVYSLGRLVTDFGPRTAQEAAHSDHLQDQFMEEVMTVTQNVAKAIHAKGTTETHELAYDAEKRTVTEELINRQVLPNMDEIGENVAKVMRIKGLEPAKIEKTMIESIDALNDFRGLSRLNLTTLWQCALECPAEVFDMIPQALRQHGKDVMKDCLTEDGLPVFTFVMIPERMQDILRHLTPNPHAKTQMLLNDGEGPIIR
jgi:hypothetical protein